MLHKDGTLTGYWILKFGGDEYIHSHAEYCTENEKEFILISAARDGRQMVKLNEIQSALYCVEEKSIMQDYI